MHRRRSGHRDNLRAGLDGPLLVYRFSTHPGWYELVLPLRNKIEVCLALHIFIEIQNLVRDFWINARLTPDFGKKTYSPLTRYHKAAKAQFLPKMTVHLVEIRQC